MQPAGWQDASVGQKPLSEVLTAKRQYLCRLWTGRWRSLGGARWRGMPTAHLNGKET